MAKDLTGGAAWARQQRDTIARLRSEIAEYDDVVTAQKDKLDRVTQLIDGWDDLPCACDEFGAALCASCAALCIREVVEA